MPAGEFDTWIELSCHPSTSSDAVYTIQASVLRSDSRLRIGYRLEGDMGRILVPPPSEPLIGIELWRHTCFETFLKIDGTAAYHEFNFAPSSAWTVYAFSGYRDGAPLADESMNPQIAVRSQPGELELDATVKLDRLSELHRDGVLRVGLSAVIETNDGLSYWALHHPTDKPDFHNPEGFALTLDRQ